MKLSIPQAAFLLLAFQQSAAPSSTSCSAFVVPRHGTNSIPARNVGPSVLTTSPSQSQNSASALGLSVADAIASKDVAVMQLSNVVHAINDIVSTFLQTKLAMMLQLVQSLLETAELVDVANELVTAVSSQFDQYLKANYPGFEVQYANLVESISAAITSAGIDPAVLLLTSSVVAFSIVVVASGGDNEETPLRPYPTNRYDPESARLYFKPRVGEVLARSIGIALQSARFGLSLLQDKLKDEIAVNEEKRAFQLAELLTKLGPTFIKIGQSLSIRTDLLSPAYVRGLSSLQDQVKAFDSDIGREILQKEWGGRSVDSVLKTISDEPVAAASLGQVYKATMMDGREIAIKVQRPNIMNQVALDMHLLREFAPIAKNTFNLNTDTTGTVDAWGSGFVDELDYLQEAKNAQDFMEKIQETPLKDVVLAPDVVEELSTGKVLVTEWVDGERLDKSSNEDITVLCSIAMNTYLTMMLEIGLLHCDPHPGNLLRTTEGKLCVLDWGMVTRLDSNLQLTLIEHMAHLTSADYAEIPRDLLLLGFIPKDKADLIEDSGVVELLADIYGAWSTGGGVAAINVNKVISQLQDLTAEKGNLFQIPPYFAYIAKSFSVLEGIGLSNDDKYSIINECLPYVSKRLLTDKSQMGPALSTFIFGPDKSNVDTRIVDIDRVEQLVTGFGNYTTSASGAMLGQQNVTAVQTLETAADYLLDIVFTEEESPVQDILLEQLAKIATSASRSVWSGVRQNSGTLPGGRTVLGTIVDPLGLFRQSSLVEMSELDHKTVETTRRLVDLLQKQAAANGQTVDLSELQPNDLLQLSTILAQKFWDRRLGLVMTGSRFATKLLKLTADKLESAPPIRRRLAPATPPTATTSDEDTDKTDEATASHNANQPAPLAVPDSVRTESSRLMHARSQLAKYDNASN